MQIEELAVDGFEEGEEGGRMCELAVDGFFEYIKEFVEGAGKGDARALGGAGAEDLGDESPEEGGFTAALEKAATVQKAVDVVED